MLGGLCGRILSLDLRSLIPSTQTMRFNLIAKLSEGIVVIWVLEIDTQLWLTHKGMDRPGLLIKS